MYLYMWFRVEKAGRLLKAVDAIPITARELCHSGVQKLWKEKAETASPASTPLKIGKPTLRYAIFWD